MAQELTEFDGDTRVFGREVEADCSSAAARTQIMDKQETMGIVQTLMENIEKLQNDYDILLKEYNELKAKLK